MHLLGLLLINRNKDTQMELIHSSFIIMITFFVIKNGQSRYHSSIWIWIILKKYCIHYSIIWYHHLWVLNGHIWAPISTHKHPWAQLTTIWWGYTYQLRNVKCLPQNIYLLFHLPTSLGVSILAVFFLFVMKLEIIENRWIRKTLLL